MTGLFAAPLAGVLPVLAAVPLERAAILSAILFAIGLAGVTCRRNILIMLLSVEIMLNAANLMLVTFSRVHGDLTGQVFVFFAMVVAAAEVSVGLAIVIAVYRLRRTTDVGDVCDLAETDYGPVVYPQLEGTDPHHHDDGHDAGGGDGDEPTPPEEPEPGSGRERRPEVTPAAGEVSR